MLEAQIDLTLPAIKINIDLNVQNETLVLFGPSGAGKTLTVKMIAGLERPDRGQIRVAGRVVFDSETGIDISPQQRNLGYVPQRSGVFPHLTALENVVLPLRYGRHRFTAEEAHRRSLRLLDRFGLRDRARARPAELSGGELQRVALARVLAMQPDVLLVDEPFAALDAPVRADLRREFRAFRRELGIPAIFITHDIEEAAIVGDRLAIMAAGTLRQTGVTREVLDRPRDRDVASLVQSRNVFDGTVVWRDGEATVETPIGPLRIVDHHLQNGQQVTAVVRPEVIRVMRDDRGTSRFSDSSMLQGSIIEVADHGAMTSVMVRLAASHLTVTLSPTAVANLELMVGKVVRLAIPPADVHLIIE